MKRFFASVLVWVLILAIFYFSADIIERGQVLNALTPIPFMGYVLWIGIILLLWFLFIKPAYDFCRLTSSRALSVENRLNVALKALEPYDVAAPGDSRRKLYAELYKAKERELYETAQGCEDIDKLLERFNGESEEGKLIKSYSIAAGIGVVFSRNPMLDGVVLLVMQLQLVIALAKKRGYRPSPVFNLCCFGWIISNSIVAALSQDALEELAEDGAKYMIDMIADTETVASFASVIKIPQNIISLTMQGVLAGTSVYVVGQLFRSQLNREGKQISMKRLLDLRGKGYRAVGESVVQGVKDKWGILERLRQQQNPVHITASETPRTQP